MNTSGRISLLPQDMLALKGVKQGLERRSFGRMKALVEGSPLPFHIPPSRFPRKPAVVLTPDQGQPLVSRTQGPGAGAQETLRLMSAGWIGPDLSLLVRKDWRIDNIDSMAFADVARAGGFELETMAFSFNPLGRRIYISGNGPLGSAIITPERFNGGTSWDMWQAMATELSGIDGKAAYVGSMVDTSGRPGRITIVGLVESCQIPMKGTAIPWAMEDVARLVSESRESLDRRLRTALIVCGHSEWGIDFLKKADK